MHATYRVYANFTIVPKTGRLVYANRGDANRGDANRGDANRGVRLYISITSLLALTLLTRIWDYGYDSTLKTSINA